MRPYIHLVLHFLVPFLVARIFYPPRWRKVWLILVLTMVIDLDHLFADPLYDPNRCSIGFHPLHSWPAIVVYAVFAAIPATRIPALGLLIHIALDGIDCVSIILTSGTSFSNS